MASKPLFQPPVTIFATLERALLQPSPPPRLPTHPKCNHPGMTPTSVAASCRSDHFEVQFVQVKRIRPTSEGEAPLAKVRDRKSPVQPGVAPYPAAAVADGPAGGGFDPLGVLRKIARGMVLHQQRKAVQQNGHPLLQSNQFCKCTVWGSTINTTVGTRVEGAGAAVLCVTVGCLSHCSRGQCSALWDAYCCNFVPKKDILPHPSIRTSRRGGECR